MINFLKAVSNPDKYAIELPINKIVADNKVDKKGIQKIINDFKDGKSIKSIVVVKHPEKEYQGLTPGESPSPDFRINVRRGADQPLRKKYPYRPGRLDRCSLT